jgi:predicted protein tyrosine phosphatase
VIHGLLFLAPALLLLGVLLLRRYPGERLLLARLPRGERTVRPAPHVARAVALVLGRPGRLVAGRDEIRGPPCVVVLPTT